MGRENAMVIYSNITSLMSTEGITYSDRVVLHVLLSVVCKGYDVELFISQNDRYMCVSGQMLAEYFFTKNIYRKSMYITQKEMDLTLIGQDDTYFEVDIIDNEKKWKDYYSKIEKTNCQMYSYLYFGNVFDENEERVSSRVQEQMKYMNGIFVANKQIEEMIYKTSSKCLAKIEILKLETFAVECKEDMFLEIDKGFAQIIREGNYVVCLHDCDNLRTNTARINEVRKRFIDKKIIYAAMPQAETDKYLKNIDINREIGKRLFFIRDVDYYTLKNLYASALTVVVPKYCKSCEFELANIQKLNGNCLFL